MGGLGTVERLDKTSVMYGMKISAEKTKLMTTNTRVISQNPETVHRFKYLGSIVTDERSKPEVL